MQKIHYLLIGFSALRLLNILAYPFTVGRNPQFSNEIEEVILQMHSNKQQGIVLQSEHFRYFQLYELLTTPDFRLAVTKLVVRDLVFLPIVEETFFRKFLRTCFRHVKIRTPLDWIPTFYFSVWKLLTTSNWTVDMIHIPYWMLVSVSTHSVIHRPISPFVGIFTIFAVAYEHTENLVFPILLHMIHNLAFIAHTIYQYRIVESRLSPILL